MTRHFNSSRRAKRAQWLDDAEALGKFTQWYGSGCAEDIGRVLAVASIARRERRLARRRAA